MAHHRKQLQRTILVAFLHLALACCAPSLQSIKLYNNNTHNFYQFTITPLSALTNLDYANIYLNTNLTYTSGYADATYKSCAKYLIQLCGTCARGTGIVQQYTGAYYYKLPSTVSSAWLWQPTTISFPDVQGTVDYSTGQVKVLVKRAGIQETNLCTDTAGVVIETTYSGGLPPAVSPSLTHIYSPDPSCTAVKVRDAQPPQTSDTSARAMVSFSAVYAITPAFSTKAVLIDTDRKATTGSKVTDPSGKAIGADYMLANGKLYSWSAAAWKLSTAAVTFTDSPTTRTATWTLLRSALGDGSACRSAYDAIYMVATSTPTAANYTTPTTQVYLSTALANLAVPMYVYPCTAPYTRSTNTYASTAPSCTYFSTLMTYMPNSTTLAVLNPANGPSSPSAPLFLTTKANYRQQIQTIKTNYPTGSLLLGYVASGYAANTTAAYTAQVTTDIDNWFKHYSTGFSDPKVTLDGIFIDEVASADCSYLPFYTALVTAVRQAAKKYGVTKLQTVVLNPGQTLPECFLQTGADIFILFENTYSQYLTSYTPSGWEHKVSPSRIWHLVHSCPRTSLASATALAKSRRAGWVYATPDTLDNPWDTMPTPTDWRAEYVAVSGLPSCTV